MSPIFDARCRARARWFCCAFLCVLLSACASTPPAPTADFVNVQDFFRAAGQELRVDARYHGVDNFVGESIDGYREPVVLLTREAATALLAAQRSLAASGLAFKIFDGYRPQRAVDHFVRWARDLDDVRQKQRYYPHVAKANLFRDGYIAQRSGHSRGSTVDLTLVTATTGEELPMGTRWDFFDPASWPSSRAVGVAQQRNRARLRAVMVEHGFRPLREEWWHFTLDPEPYPDTYFDFEVRSPVVGPGL